MRTMLRYESASTIVLDPEHALFQEDSDLCNLYEQETRGL